MRLALSGILSAAIGYALIGAAPAHADHQPVIVVPGKAGVPVIINGRNAAGAMVIGDWGLYRPGHMAPIVVPLRSFRPAPRVRRHHRRGQRRRVRVVQPFRHYFPGGELTRPAMKAPAPVDYAPPKPAESFSREWSTHSMPVPASVEPPPPIVIEPSIEPRRFRPGGGPGPVPRK
jgi:hypothetical protein